MFVNKEHKKRTLINVPLIALAFMAFAPFGSFNPTKLGFWMSIITGLSIAFSTSYTLYVMHKKYGDGGKDHKEEAIFGTKKHIKRIILGAVLLALLFMTFSPYGSFNPLELEFWTSVTFGLTTSFITGCIIYVLHRKYSDGRKSRIEEV